MTEKLNKQDLDLINEENLRYQATHDAVVKEARKQGRALEENESLARELTSQVVNTQREEDKQALQSDESVAHGLTKLRLEQNRSLALLLEQPYFARVMYHENGKDVEFKLGLASFPEQRIIDWRKAPISKLYYDYDENDEFDTEIAGRERQGVIKLRRAYQGRRNELHQIELKDTSYVLNHGKWYKHGKMKSQTFSIKEKQKIKELIKEYQQGRPYEFKEESGYLGQILALLSPEQFCLISTETDKPVIIQGSAGTGKTTVALHRLAWLMFEQNSTVKQEQTLVLVFNKSLAAYVSHVLPELGIHKVKIATFFDWALDVIKTTQSISEQEVIEDVPRVVQAYKTWHKRLPDLMAYVANHLQNKTAIEILLGYYEKQLQEDFYLKKRHNLRLRHYIGSQVSKKIIDASDLALILHIIYFKNKSYRGTKLPGFLDYLVIDEAQDFNAIEIKAILNALSNKHNLTLAGDLGQKIHSEFAINDWHELLQEAGLTGVDVLNLKIAYRSTYQIYELAEYIRDPHLKEEELELTPKFGPEPKLTLCHAFQDGVLFVKNWLNTVWGTNRNIIGAVICKTSVDARKVYDALIKMGTRGIRLGDVSHFEFTPGITITDVKQVKGLEFSHVLLFNPSENEYKSNSGMDRNFLYVAITRASYKVDMVCFDRPSHLIPDFININDLTQTFEDLEDRPLFSDIDQDIPERN